MSALLEGRGLVKRFTSGERNWLGRPLPVQAVRGVDITLVEGETLALVGESGCGKSTLGQLMIDLTHPDRGDVHYRGEKITGVAEARWQVLRRELQTVFQSAGGSLDPRIKVAEQIAEPLEIHGIGSASERRAKAAAMLEAVGLRPEQGERYPHQLSGGQLQRVIIARALVLDPAILVLDEPVAALDVSIRAQIVNLLIDLQEQFQLSYLFISHDLGLVRRLADRVAVMYLGRIVELAPTAELFARPRHPYTQALLSAIPVPDPEVRRERILLDGDPPSPVRPPKGCGFAPRCRRAIGRCHSDDPDLIRTINGHPVACHLAEAA